MPTMPTALHSSMHHHRSGWLDRWLALRDRLLASRNFQRKAAAFGPTAPIARDRARGLFDLVAGFVYSQVLLACVQLQLFDLLADGPVESAALAHRLDLSPEACDRLVAAAVSLRLLERRRGDRVGLGELGAPMVGNAALAAMVQHHGALYSDLRDPVALLRGTARDTALSRYWPYAGAADAAGSVDAAGADPGRLSDDNVADYSALMAASQPLVADEILDAYSLTGHRRLLDVGGGEGGFLASAAARTPGLQLTLFDLPAVAERARRRAAATGLSERMTIVGGNFLCDPLPTGADVASLVRVIHDHDDATAMRILRAVRCALPVDGSLLLAEPLAATPGAESMGDAYFGFYLLAMGRGRARTVQQLTALLVAAGFDRVRQHKTRMPLQTGLLVARAALFPGAHA